MPITYNSSCQEHHPSEYGAWVIDWGSLRNSIDSWTAPYALSTRKTLILASADDFR